MKSIRESQASPGPAFGLRVSQAPCVEYAMLFRLEGLMKEAAKARDPLWLSYLGVYLQTVACSRIAHLQRS